MRKFLLYVILLGFNYSIAFAQLTSSENNEKPYIPSWDTYEFMKYGSVGASLYTGTVNYSVPIYTYEDEDFDYSISIDYATNGFRVNHKSGHLGHGWTLNAPGMITKEVYGLADDKTTTVIAKGGNGCQLYGYDKTPVGALDGCLLVHYLDDQTFTAMVDKDGTCYDAQPDIYRFNFCGYSGSFRRIPSEGGMSFLFFDCPSESQSLKIESVTDTGIVMIDGSGYKFSFTEGEYIKKAICRDVVDALKEKFVRQWRLQKVTAPNGRVMEFFYSHIYDNEGLDKSEHNVTYTPSLSFGFSYYAGTNEGYGSKDIGIYESDNFSTRLVGIKFADGTYANIEYVDGVKELRYTSPEGDTQNAFGDNKRISSIKIYSADETLFKKASFSYKTIGGNSVKENRLTFLHSIDISGQGVFSFEYNPMTACPPLGTIKSDHWGYYNGEYGGFDTKDFLSNLIFDSEYNERYASKFNRNPNFQSALSGTLSKICYPTGGFSTISYEQHDCSQKVVRTNSSLFYPELVSLSQNESVGGVRVKQVTTFLPDGTPTDTVRYEYQSVSNPDLSSGILINTPRYGIRYTTTNNKFVERFNLCNSMYDFLQTHIEYSHVREYRSDAGHTDYFYSSYKDYPDGTDIEEDKGHRLPLFRYYSNGNDRIVFFNNPNKLVENLLTPLASAQTKRGLLSLVKKFNSEGDLVGETKYDYLFPLVKIDTVLTLTGENARDVIYPRYNIELNSVKESLFFNKTAVSTQKTSVYNSYGMEKKTEYVMSDGNVIVDLYRYSGDVHNANGIVSKMQFAHNVNNLLLHNRKIIKNGTEQFIDRIRYNYYLPNKENGSLFKVSNIEYYSPKGWISKASYIHDDSGRIIQQTDSSGVQTSYLWGYKSRYPLMIARNATISQLNNAVTAQGLSVADLSNATGYTDYTFDKLLASANSLTSSIVDVYKFKPNFGLTEYSMPNNIKTYYSYDGYGRLVSMSDHKHQMSKQREYNLVSIAPLSLSMSCGETYINEPMNIIATADGGSHSYLFSFKIYDKLNGDIVYENTNDTGVINIIPDKAGLVSKDYCVECEVSDLISEERILSVQDISVKPVRLQFSNINKNFTYIAGSDEVCMADIYTDTTTDVTFGFELTSKELCTVSIAGTSFSSQTEKDKEFVVRLNPGYNSVIITFPSSTVVLDANLWMKEATNGHEIGFFNNLSISY